MSLLTRDRCGITTDSTGLSNCASVTMQQINLLQPELRTSQKRLPLNKALTYTGVLVAVIAVVSGVQWWQQYSQSQNLIAAKQDEKKLLKQIETVTSEIAAMSDDSDFKRVLLEKEQELNNKTNVLTVLSGQKFGNTKGFAEQFTGLSRQHVDGLWITALNIHAGGSKLNIQGSTYSPEQVPRYLQNLGNETSFKGVEFKTFLMERDQGSSQVNFDIRSTQKEAG